MCRRRHYRQLALALIGALLSGLAQAAPSVEPSGQSRTDIIVWGERMGPDSKGLEARIRSFEAKYPQYRVRVLSMGAGEMNPQKLMTAIVGRVPPDVIYQDRFSVSDWAHRGAFEELDPFIARDKDRDPSTPTREKYYAAAWDEAAYEGKQYAIPYPMDDRVLYYNTRLFRENADALRAAGLDPNRPPRTWSEVIAYGKVLTQFDPKTKALSRAGFIPNFGNSWLYLYSFQTNSSWLSKDGRTCTMACPETEESLKFMLAGYEALGGYAEAQKFQSTLKGGADDAFITGRIAMKIDGDWIINDLAKYGQNLEFATAPAPVPDDRYYKRGRFANEKDQFITWVGGFSYAMPKGAKNREGAWEYIKYMCGLEAYQVDCRAQSDWERRRGRQFVPRIMARIEHNQAIQTEFLPKDPRLANALNMHIAFAPYARIRPASPVAQVMWDEQVRAMEFACLKTYTPIQALKISQDVVQKELDEVYLADRYPVVNMSIPGWLGVGAVVLGVAGFMFGYSRQRMGRLGRTESRWAYIFLSPWLIGFLGLTLGPMLASLFFSFTQYNVLSDARWTSLKNYQDLIADEQQLLGKAFMNVLYLGGIGVPLGICTGLSIALLLNTGVRGMRAYRTAFYLPSIVPMVASTVLWVFILSPDAGRGLIANFWQNNLTPWFGTPVPGFLSVAEWAKPALVMMGLWGAGGGMILWLAGLKGVPTTLYEAASIDGASPWKQFWNVTLPQLSPLIFFNTVMGAIGALQMFESSYVITEGKSAGPSDALLTPVYHLFRNGFYYFKMGYSSALAWVIFIIVLVLTAVQWTLSKRWVHYEGLK